MNIINLHKNHAVEVPSGKILKSSRPLIHIPSQMSVLWKVAEQIAVFYFIGNKVNT